MTKASIGKFVGILNGLMKVAAVAVLVLVVIEKTNDERGKHLVTWNLYHGTIQAESNTYNVEIDESDEGFGFRKIVHLYPLGRPSYESITGHMFGTTGWDRIFICGGNHPYVDTKASGCNSVERTESGWRFEACPGDAGKIKPFSNQSIWFAESVLSSAMAKIYNREHLTSQSKWDAKQKKVVEVFRRS